MEVSLTDLVSMSKDGLREMLVRVIIPGLKSGKEAEVARAADAQTIKSLQQQLLASQKECGALANRLADHERAIARQEHNSNPVEVRAGISNNSNKELVRLSESVSRYEAKIKRRDDALEMLKKKLSVLEALVDEKDKTINTLPEQLADTESGHLKATNDKLGADLAAKDEEIARQAIQIKGLTKAGEKQRQDVTKYRTLVDLAEPSFPAKFLGQTLSMHPTWPGFQALRSFVAEGDKSALHRMLTDPTKLSHNISVVTQNAVVHPISNVIERLVVIQPHAQCDAVGRWRLSVPHIEPLPVIDLVVKNIQGPLAYYYGRYRRVALNVVKVEDLKALMAKCHYTYVKSSTASPDSIPPPLHAAIAPFYENGVLSIKCMCLERVEFSTFVDTELHASGHNNPPSQNIVAPKGKRKREESDVRSSDRPRGHHDGKKRKGSSNTS